MILFRLRYRPFTAFGPTLHNVTDRYHTVTIPFGTVPHRDTPLLFRTKKDNSIL